MSRLRTHVATVLLSLLAVSPLAAEEIRFAGDGWYRWMVPAGPGGLKSCCYRWNHGNMERRGCSLGDGKTQFSVSEPCDSDSDSMQIFVEIRNGEVHEIWPLSSDCPVQSESEIRTFENVSQEQSVAWLNSQIRSNSRVSDEAVMTVSFHRKEVALKSLFNLLEDREQEMENREQALFWLIQSDHDEAFVYLDQLLK